MKVLFNGPGENFRTQPRSAPRQLTQPPDRGLKLWHWRRHSDERWDGAAQLLEAVFTVPNKTAVQALKLRMNYDDGFVAWINRTLAASSAAR
jgi:hypothetical protein